MSLARRFDAWVSSGPFTVIDLARFRIVFAVGSLLTLFDFTWWGGFPASMYLPPPGPFQLLPGFPPVAVGYVIEIGVALALSCIAFGYRTRFACWVATVLMVLGFGFTYSFGKIDHPILFVIAPAVLSFSGWGDELSIDKTRGVKPHGFRPWAVRLLALLIGLAFLTAAIAKVRAGWLSPTTQAVRREVLTAYVDGNTGGILPWLVDLNAPVLWEAFDWLTVILELSIVVCVLSWRALRISLAVATIFHFGVYVLLTISFGFNVLVYGAFVQWSAVRLRAPSWMAQLTRRWYGLLIPAVALGLWAFTHLHPQTAKQSGFITVVGAAVAVGYLIALAVAVARNLRDSHALRRPDRSAREPGARR